MDGKDHQLQRKEAAIAAHRQEIQQLRQQPQSSEQAAIGNAASSIELRWSDDGRAPMWEKAAAIDRSVAYFSGNPQTMNEQSTNHISLIKQA